jgi:hypothetical protein
VVARTSSAWDGVSARGKKLGLDKSLNNAAWVIGQDPATLGHLGKPTDGSAVGGMVRPRQCDKNIGI